MTIAPDSAEGMKLEEQRRMDAKDAIWDDLFAGKSISLGSQKWSLHDFRNSTFEEIDGDEFVKIVTDMFDIGVNERARKSVYAWLDQSDIGKQFLDQRMQDIAEAERD